MFKKILGKIKKVSSKESENTDIENLIKTEIVEKSKLDIKMSFNKKDVTIEEMFFLENSQEIVVDNLFPDIPIIKTFEELERLYNLKDYYHLENNIPSKFKVLAENKRIVRTNKKTGKKRIGLFYPNVKISEMFFEEIFFISKELISFFYSTKTLKLSDGDDNNESSEKLGQILSYMETNSISDLHFYLQNDFQYVFTERKNSNVEKVSGLQIRKELMKNLINEAIIACGQDTFTRKKEIRGLIKRELLSKGKKVERSFRLHIIESSTGSEIGNSVSIRKLMTYEELIELGFSGLGYNDKAIALIKKAIKLNHNGVMIVSGATNSGKSTLLYTILIYLLKMGKRIHTIEAPIEIVIPGLIQIDLKSTETAQDEFKIDMTQAIKSLLSQDPDIGLINEVRSSEEINDLMNLALQGHLAFSTMHANDIKTTFKRLKKNTSQEDINSSVKLIINQELINKKCNKCSEEGMITTKENTKIVCPTCRGKKIVGRMPIYEVALYNNIEMEDDMSDFKTLIKEEKLEYVSKEEVIEEYAKEGIVFEEDVERIRSHFG